MKTKKVSKNENVAFVKFWNEVLDHSQMKQVKGGDGSSSSGGQNEGEDDWGQ